MNKTFYFTYGKLEVEAKVTNGRVDIVNISRHVDDDTFEFLKQHAQEIVYANETATAG